MERIKTPERSSREIELQREALKEAIAGIAREIYEISHEVNLKNATEEDLIRYLEDVPREVSELSSVWDKIWLPIPYPDGIPESLQDEIDKLETIEEALDFIPESEASGNLRAQLFIARIRTDGLIEKILKSDHLFSGLVHDVFTTSITELGVNITGPVPKSWISKKLLPPKDAYEPVFAAARAKTIEVAAKIGVHPPFSLQEHSPSQQEFSRLFKRFPDPDVLITTVLAQDPFTEVQ